MPGSSSPSGPPVPGAGRRDGRCAGGATRASRRLPRRRGPGRRRPGWSGPQPRASTPGHCGRWSSPTRSTAGWPWPDRWAGCWPSQSLTPGGQRCRAGNFPPALGYLDPPPCSSFRSPRTRPWCDSGAMTRCSGCRRSPRPGCDLVGWTPGSSRCSGWRSDRMTRRGWMRPRGSATSGAGSPHERGRVGGVGRVGRRQRRTRRSRWCWSTTWSPRARPCERHSARSRSRGSSRSGQPRWRRRGGVFLGAPRDTRD